MMKSMMINSPVTQVALSHLLLRILCLLIVEHECALLVQKSSGMPAVMGNYVLASIFVLGFICCLARPRLGFMIGMLAATINIIAKVVIIVKGHEHFPYYPIVWITQCLLVLYFCYLGLSRVCGHDDTGIMDAV